MTAIRPKVVSTLAARAGLFALLWNTHLFVVGVRRENHRVWMQMMATSRPIYKRFETKKHG